MSTPANNYDDERLYERQFDEPEVDDDPDAEADDPCADDGLGDY